MAEITRKINKGVKRDFFEIPAEDLEPMLPPEYFPPQSKGTFIAEPNPPHPNHIALDPNFHLDLEYRKAEILFPPIPAETVAARSKEKTESESSKEVLLPPHQSYPPEVIKSAMESSPEGRKILREERAKQKRNTALTDVGAIKKIDVIFGRLNPSDRKRVMEFVGNKWFSK